MITMIKAFPTTDGNFVYWTVNAMIPDCLGFALFRDVKGAGISVVESWVGFEDEDQTLPKGTHKPSTEWPIQKTSWTDFLGASNKATRYRVVLRTELLSLLGQAKKDKRPIYAALYELNDPELIAALQALGAMAHVVLGNSTGKKTEQTAKETEDSAQALAASGVDIVRRKIAPKRYAHNKFVVFTDRKGNPAQVWTGSTNWTRTGLCTQNNNGLLITEADVASDFKSHWQAIHDAGDQSPPAFAKADDREWQRKVGDAYLRTWFTPTTKGGDLTAAMALINNAKQGILFLMLNPGPDGLLGPILEQLEARDEEGNARLYIRGVVNNFPNEGKDSAGDSLSLMTSDGERQSLSGSDLENVLRPAAIDASADWWQRELKNTRKFMIAVHSKVIVIDPSGEAPVVMTGSHNFSKRASRTNDDNLVIIEGDPALASAYAANVIGIYNTYRWQAWRNTAQGQQDKGIKRNDQWLAKRIGKPWAQTEARFWLGS